MAHGNGSTSLPVWEALIDMATAIRSGKIHEARGIGERCVVPLSITSQDVSMSGKLSAGSESTVFRGCWRGRDVAVKKVRISTSADLDRFRREAAALAALAHPAVVPLLAARALPPDYLLVLPLAPGGTVRQALYERGWRPSWGQLLGLAHAVAAGMAHVHAAGLLHRDLKPANLLLLEPLQGGQREQGEQGAQQAGEQQQQQHGQQQSELRPQGAAAEGQEAGIQADSAGHVMEAGAAVAAGAEERGLEGEELPGGLVPVRVQIADFGIAVRMEGAAEGGAARLGGGEAASVAAGNKPSGGFYKRQMAGTLEYMAPELLLRSAPPSAAADVYAWAVTLNEVATGVVPFSDCTKDNPEVHTVLEMGYGRMELAAAVCAEGLRPLLPRRCPPAFAALMRACWAADPAGRPSFTQVLRALERLAEELPEWEAAQQQQREEEEQEEEEEQGGCLRRQQSAGDGGAKASQACPHPRVVVDVMASDSLDLSTTRLMHDSGGGGGQAGSASDGGAKAAANPPHCTECRACCTHQPHADAQQAAAPQEPAAQPVMWPFVLCPPDEYGSGGGGGLGAAADDACDSGGGGGSNRPIPEWLRQPLQSQQQEQQEAGGGGGGGDVGLIFNGGVFEAIGPRDTMEDRCLLLQDLWGRQAPQQPQHNSSQEEPQLPPHPQQQPQQQPHATLSPAKPPSQHPSQDQPQAAGEGREDRAHGGAGATTAAVVAGVTGSQLPPPLPPLDRVPTLPVAAVFDGHRGGEAAEFCRARLPAVLRAAVLQCGSPAEALRRAFVRLEEDYHSHWQQQRRQHVHRSSGPHAFPGATALVALLAPGGRLLVANAGDCRAVLCRGRRALAASRDHTGLLEEERRRVERAGVAVTWAHGSWRIGSSGLQVTRCIGDFDVKGGLPAASDCPATGVTALPEVSCVQLQPDDHFLILASDGLWDVMSVQEAAGLVYDTVKDPSLAAKRLACEALMRGSADNVTVVVVFLTHVATLERVYEVRGGESFGVTGTAYGSRIRMAADRHVAPTLDEIRETY